MADKKLKRPDFILQKDFFVKNDANEQETGPKHKSRRVQKEIKRRKQAVRKIKKYKAEHHSAYMLHFD